MPYDTSNNTLIVSTSNHQDDDETAIVDDLQRLVNYQISDGATTLMPQTQAALAMNMIPAGTIPNNALWDMWNPIVPDGNRDHYTNIPFK
ncbi:unnamed protein product [Arabidopsis thaliana]|nr:unnamed protein product [Arabidopsis thaliana]